MQSRTQLRVTLWLCLALCVLRLHAFPFPIPFVDPYTSQQDVDAINDLYAALGSPDLDGWTDSGGDPCNEGWLGVQCDGPNITAIELRGAGLGGKLSETLGYFTAITRLDLSSNQIGGGIPQSLPPAVTKLDLSSNDLSGELPDSMAKLSSLWTLHVQNNQLNGTLDALGDLPLRDLNVENNLFSGSIPEKLLAIPKFLRNGNHFTVVPPIPGSSPTPSTPPNHVPAPPAEEEPPVLSGSHPPVNVIPDTPQVDRPRHNNKVSPAKAAGFSILAAGSLGIAVVAIVFMVSKRRREGSPNADAGYLRGVEMSSEAQPSQLAFTFFTVASLQQHTNSFGDQNLIRETCFGKIYLAQFQESKVTWWLITAPHPKKKHTSSDRRVHGQFFIVLCYILNLDHHLFCAVQFAVLKLDGSAAKMPVAEFLKIVQGIAELRHPNVEELVGCCVDHGQRLLVYRHLSDSTLSDLIHSEDAYGSATEKTLPWDARVAVALQAAKALEYLHQKQVVHRHFRPEHVLVDDELQVSVSGGGLAPFVALELTDYCDGTPEAAAWAAKGDVYSFGVVMLQLLTGRKPYDSSRARGERHLVPCSRPRLHDLAALRTMADPRLGHPPPVRSLSRFADIIGRCIQHEAEFRPGMSQVAQDLRRALDDDARAGSSGVEYSADTPLVFTYTIDCHRPIELVCL
ncbi:hypothetical protein PR202_ga06404 [Eleusine coracana subsp. coracana]|uniref:Protein kinase domain-containing protein n=1 Tax=Eleusine coracana subsp. coracana TaxID=191504 RepID=A0AAV5BUY3_ELECO|nr:hypothetical protein PR202_ga06404 [Eleusine coracana subsp. coracana]